MPKLINLPTNFVLIKTRKTRTHTHTHTCVCVCTYTYWSSVNFRNMYKLFLCQTNFIILNVKYPLKQSLRSEILILEDVEWSISVLNYFPSRMKKFAIFNQWLFNGYSAMETHSMSVSNVTDKRYTTLAKVKLDWTEYKLDIRCHASSIQLIVFGCCKRSWAIINVCRGYTNIDHSRALVLETTYFPKSLMWGIYCSLTRLHYFI